MRGKEEQWSIHLSPPPPNSWRGDPPTRNHTHPSYPQGYKALLKGGCGYWLDDHEEERRDCCNLYCHTRTHHRHCPAGTVCHAVSDGMVSHSNEIACRGVGDGRTFLLAVTADQMISLALQSVRDVQAIACSDAMIYCRLCHLTSHVMYQWLVAVGNWVTSCCTLLLPCPCAPPT
jgi:hypothetical protein